MRNADRITAPMCALPVLLLAVSPCFGAGTGDFIRGGEAGFVVSHIEYALAGDAAETGACPGGMSLTLQEIHALTAEGKRRGGESDEAYMTRLQAAARQLGTAPDGRDLCMHPEAGGPDPHFRTVAGSAVTVSGIDLDGRATEEDFPGLDGGEGVDNQWFRAVGCSRSYQPSGQSNTFAIGMLSGSWGILLRLHGVDDLRNDELVEVSFLANADPIRLSPAREALTYATYTAQGDPRFRATAAGRIDNGVLTTEPVDVRFWSEVNSMYLERPLLDARLRVMLSEDGKLAGYLAGYSPVEAMYDVAFGYRSAVKSGQPAPLQLRSGSANGAAAVLGHTCHGAYYALRQLADGHADPATGRYTAISTQYRIEALPAFVVDAADTASAGHQPAVAAEGGAGDD